MSYVWLRFGMFQSDNWWTLSRFWLGLEGIKETIGWKCLVFGYVLTEFKETIDGFMSHVENSSSWGMGYGAELVHCL